MKPFTKRLALVMGLLFTALICMGIVYIDTVQNYWYVNGGFVKLIVSNQTQRAIMTVDTNTFRVGFNTNNTIFSFLVAGQKPATNTGNGTSAATSGRVQLTGGNGGESDNPTTATGGAGGLTVMTGGAGGNANAATTNATGGNGGASSVTGGAGGAGSTSAGVATNAATGGNGGTSSVSAGVGGSPGASATNTVGGDGGASSALGGNGGTPSAGWARKGGNGGVGTFSGGAGGTGVRTNGGDGGSGTFSGGQAGAVSGSGGNAGAAGVANVIGGAGATAVGGGTNSNGGNVFIAGGAPGSGAVPGNVVLNVTSGGTVRGNTGIGTNFPVSRLHVRQEAATTNEVVIRQTWGVTDSAVSTTNRSTIITNDWVLNQYYTNKVSRAWVYSSWTLQAGATDAAQLSIFIDRDGDGIPDATGHTIRQGVALTTANIYELSRMIPAGAAFVFTNQSGATATTPAVVNASSQWAND